jgi:hypothetical protein
MALSHLGNAGALLEALSYDLRLLLSRPPALAAFSGDHLNTTIGIAREPGIKLVEFVPRSRKSSLDCTGFGTRATDGLCKPIHDEKFRT